MRNRTTVMLGLLVSLCMMTGNVQGQGTPLGHLKKDNPNELFVLFMQDDACGDSYKRIVNNELAQSRIKKVDDPPGYDIPVLWVSISCMTAGSVTGIVFNIDVKFIRTVPAFSRQPEENTWTVISHSPGYGNYGFADRTPVTNEQHVSNLIRQCVENALTDYLKVNFDL